MSSKWRSTFLAGGVVAALLATPLSASASPIGQSNSVTATATAAISAVAPEVLENVAAVQAGVGAKTSQISGVEIKVPADAAHGITMSNGHLSVSIGLPSNTKLSLATSAKTNVTVYDNPDGFQVVPVVKTDGRLQITTVIESATSPSRYDYALSLPSGVTPILDQSGAVFFVDPTGAFAGAIEIPWALDANGKAVPTRFELNGSVLTQVVDISAPGIAFPVVADPTVTYMWWGYLLKYNKSETRSIANQSDTAHAAALFCAFIPVVPAAALCGVVGYALITAYWNVFKSAAGQGKCVQANVAYAGPIPTTLWEVKC